jgi:hypothetical protein
MKAGCVPIANGRLNRSRRFDGRERPRRLRRQPGSWFLALEIGIPANATSSLHPVARQLVGNFGLDRFRRHNILFASGGISPSLLG